VSYKKLFDVFDVSVAFKICCRGVNLGNKARHDLANSMHDV
jgi:hypothetical protein